MAEEATQKEIYASRKQTGGSSFPPSPPPPSPVAVTEGGETEYWEGGEARLKKRGKKKTEGGKKGWLRKHMTGVFHELLDKKPDTLYIGEDVQHGGSFFLFSFFFLSFSFPSHKSFSPLFF